jgi:hypothetical protein
MAKKMTPKKYAEIATGVRLSSHEKLCAERMKQIQEAIKDLKIEVKSLRQDVLKGKGAVAALILIGSSIAGIIGFFKLNA